MTFDDGAVARALILAVKYSNAVLGSDPVGGITGTLCHIEAAMVQSA
jgi:hypothetical protein